MHGGVGGVRGVVHLDSRNLILWPVDRFILLNRRIFFSCSHFNNRPFAQVEVVFFLKKGSKILNPEK